MGQGFHSLLLLLLLLFFFLGGGGNYSRELLAKDRHHGLLSAPAKKIEVPRGTHEVETWRKWLEPLIRRLLQMLRTVGFSRMFSSTIPSLCFVYRSMRIECGWLENVFETCNGDVYRCWLNPWIHYNNDGFHLGRDRYVVIAKKYQL